MRTLLLGSGNSRVKKIVHELSPDKEFDVLTTLDVVGDPDIKWDLNVLPYPLNVDGMLAKNFPHCSGLFDEIHAYEVLEHCGTQGDEKFFFDQFNEFWRILKPGGVFCGSVPNYKSIWAFGDPGHKRVLPPTVFNYLEESHYDQLGKTTCADYRHLIKGYWKAIGMHEKEATFFLLQKA